VSFHTRDKIWQATIKITGEKKSRHIGSFATAEEAAKARDKVALESNNNNNTCYKLNFPI
jgi:hypothetical protein